MKKQSMKDKMDESMGERRGKESTKKQSMMDRRHESMGSKKCKMGVPVKMGRKASARGK